MGNEYVYNYYLLLEKSSNVAHHVCMSTKGEQVFETSVLASHVKDIIQYYLASISLLFNCDGKQKSYITAVRQSLFWFHQCFHVTEFS